jgi:hypothetical protein
VDQDVSDIFTHMDFDTQQLHQLCDDIQALDQEHPALWNYKIVKELDLDTYDWGRGYLLKRILPDLKTTLNDHGLISIETQSPRGSTNQREVWVLND